MIADQHHRPQIKRFEMVESAQMHRAAAALDQPQVAAGKADLHLGIQFSAPPHAAAFAEDREDLPVKIPAAFQQQPEGEGTRRVGRSIILRKAVEKIFRTHKNSQKTSCVKQKFYNHI